MRKAISGYEGYYEIDEDGSVYSLPRTIHVIDNGREYDKPLCGKKLTPSIRNGNGYSLVCLTKDGKSKHRYLHRLLAEAFIPNPDNLPCINHKDEDKSNNSLSNLEWCTVRYNNTYGTKIARRREKVKGVPHTAEHNRKISESIRKHYLEVDGAGVKVACIETGQVFPNISECSRITGVPHETIRKSCINRVKKGKAYTFRFANEFSGERKDGDGDES